MKPISVGISGYCKIPQKICPHTILLFVEQPQPQQNATSSNCYGRILCNHLSTSKRFDKLRGIPLILSILMLFSMLFNFIELHSIFDLGINLYLHVKQWLLGPFTCSILGFGGAIFLISPATTSFPWSLWGLARPTSCGCFPPLPTGQRVVQLSTKKKNSKWTGLFVSTWLGEQNLLTI